MALSAPTTPKTPRRLGKENHPPETPECFRQVTVETPHSAKRASKDRLSRSHKVSNLQVAVRIRPMNSRELAIPSVHNVVEVDDENYVKVCVSNGTTISNFQFPYDHVFWSCDDNENYASQEDVYKAIGQPLLDSAFSGYNGCLFAYGQTGSGKSYSMMGQNFGELIDIDVNAGIIPRFCKNLFSRLKNLGSKCVSSVEISYFEIYNEKIHNLLVNDPPNNRQPLKVREHPVWGPYVVDLSVHSVKDYKELRNLLLIGNKHRATAATSMNDNSSRSHSIFTIEISISDGDSDGDSCRRSKVCLVDLAGSERLSSVGNNEERIKQGVCINKSLLTLRKVITALAEQKKGNQYVPYRESILTWLLRENLGGNSLTCMLATVTPASSNTDETLATLRYACQARSIVNRACVNENPNDKLIRELKEEVGRLRALRYDFERSSLSSINTSMDREHELDELRQKLVNKEEELFEAQIMWEQKLIDAKRKQSLELANAEKEKAELESHVRVLGKFDDLSLSPYQTDFFDDVNYMLHEDDEELNGKLSKATITERMNQIYGVLCSMRPAVDCYDDPNVALCFAKANKALQAFEAALNSSLKTPQKSVKFKL